MKTQKTLNQVKDELLDLYQELVIATTNNEDLSEIRGDIDDLLTEYYSLLPNQSTGDIPF
jgi:hypothetical protein